MQPPPNGRFHKWTGDDHLSLSSIDTSPETKAEVQEAGLRGEGNMGSRAGQGDGEGNAAPKIL